MRGYVLELGTRPCDRLREIHSVSGDLPVFDRGLLDVLRWAANHYVAPLSVLADRSAPPNLPRSVPCPDPEPSAPGEPPPELRGWAQRAATGSGPYAAYHLQRPGEYEWLGVLGPVLATGRSVVVVVPTEVEATAHADAARSLLPGSPVDVVTSALADRDATAMWSRSASCPGRVLIGTPRVALWPVARPGGLVAVEEGRRAMKERQTPTLAVREILRRRALGLRLPLLYVGPTPSVEALAEVGTILRSRRRLWSHVQIVDRRSERGLLTPEVRRAVAATVAAGKDVLLFSHRRGYAPASRCVACGTVRRCPECGSRPDRGDTCVRCGATLGPCPECGGRRFEPLGAGVGRVAEEARRIVGAEAVAVAPDRGPVVVGSERDLPYVGRPALAVVVDADGLLLATNYRAAEEALRVMARVAGTVSTASGSRTMIQTALPDHPVMESLRRSDPVPFLRREMAERARFGYPPAAELLVVEVRGGQIDDLDAQMAAAAAGASLHGPAQTPAGRRWLVQGASLDDCRRRLRRYVQAWRDAGATVRIDADPIDL